MLGKRGGLDLILINQADGLLDLAFEEVMALQAGGNTSLGHMWHPGPILLTSELNE